jgi:hypothetical protein
MKFATLRGTGASPNKNSNGNKTEHEDLIPKLSTKIQIQANTSATIPSESSKLVGREADPNYT